MMENNIYHLMSICDGLEKKIGSLYAVCVVLASLVGVSVVISIMALILGHQIETKLDFIISIAKYVPAPDFSHRTEQTFEDRVHLKIPPKLKTKTAYDKDTNNIRSEFAKTLEKIAEATSSVPANINSKLAYTTDLSSINISMGAIENDPFTTTAFLTSMVILCRGNRVDPLKVLVSAKCLWDDFDHDPHIIDILHQLSVTDAIIVVFNDYCSDGFTQQFIERVTRLNIRVDRLIDWDDSIAMEDFASFDIVFTPNAGMRSAYELCHSVIRKLVNR